MKQIRTVALVVALLANSVSAFAEGKIAVGAQGGLTFSNYKFKNTSATTQYGNKDGWLGGIFAEFGLGTITLRPEVNYVSKPYTVANVAEVKSRYLEIPVLVKINPFSDSIVSPFILAGPQWSKRLSTDVETVAGTTTYDNTADGWDASVLAGLGVEFNILANVAFSLQGRYAYGFRDIDSSSLEVKTRGFYALAGLSLQNAF
jgi:opacity protein-like surface antigen